MYVFTHAPCGSMGLQTDFFPSSSSPSSSSSSPHHQLFVSIMYRKRCGGGGGMGLSLLCDLVFTPIGGGGKG